MEENKSYCVTGGTGFIGSWLIKSLLQMGYKVHAAVRHPGSFFYPFLLSKLIQPPTPNQMDSSELSKFGLNSKFVAKNLSSSPHALNLNLITSTIESRF